MQHITTSPSGRDQVLLSVEDTGIGKPPEDLTHLFDRTYRGMQHQPAEIP